MSMYAKYDVSISYGSKVMAKVKVFPQSQRENSIPGALHHKKCTI